ncbi:MAG: hypothetical protein OHM56_03020 [Spiroplasma phoeniceum]|nr:MAG: hypothetical protein OHM57_02470 [Spiroplasma phoeniceum]UZQ32937.1 MAG: hypothetical protein OHM56_03020 [Spiroplasma phoeniceum]
MSFKNYISKIIELQKENIYPYELILADYIKSNYNYINEEILNLNFSDKDFDNALNIASDYYMDTENISLDMISTIGITLSKWNFLSEEEQEMLLSELSFGNECLSDYLDDYIVEKYSIENEELTR